VPITEAIAMIVSKLMANRIDDNNSTASASQRRLVFNCIPAVVISLSLISCLLVLIANLSFKKEKGAA
jgi:hypothetical protein